MAEKTFRAWGAIDAKGELRLGSIGDNRGSPQTYFEDSVGIDWEEAEEEGYRVVKLEIRVVGEKGQGSH